MSFFPPFLNGRTKMTIRCFFFGFVLSQLFPVLLLTMSYLLTSFYFVFMQFSLSNDEIELTLFHFHLQLT